MIKIAHYVEVEKIEKNMPKEVVDVLENITTILDYEYGESRDVDGGDGGYILIIENKEEFSKLNKLYIDINNLIPEYVDKINCSNGETWINALILMNNDFSISLIMNEKIASKILLEEII